MARAGDRIGVSLASVNAMSQDEFVRRFGDVAEHSGWVAERAGRERPFADREAMIAAFVGAIDWADRQKQRSLLLAHPDLAGGAAIAGDVAEESKREQAGVGLDRLTADEFARLTALNAAYRKRHGIPFIFAVRGATRDAILDGFASRIANDTETEFTIALGQVGKIVRFRLENRVEDDA